MDHLGEEHFKEVILGKEKFLHTTDEEYDYLMSESENKIKVKLTFTKNQAKNEEAIKGVQIFFRGYLLHLPFSQNK